MKGIDYKMLLEITSENFKKNVTENLMPVVLDFWADWCGPCRLLSPVIEELGDELDGEIEFGKVNVDKQPELAGAYGVMSIPTVILFKEGKEVSRFVGYKEKNEVLKFLGK